jgi:peptidoglycan-associated lipoprotein
MKLSKRISVLLVALLVITAVPAFAQKSAPPATTLEKMDFGLTFTYKWAKAATISGPEFFLQGGSIDTAYTPGGKFKGLGLALDASGESAQAIKPGVNLSQISFVAGPRYTKTGSLASVYVESLFGVVHGFDSIFPAAAGPQTSATGFASQYGGGVNVFFNHHLGWRVAELDYIYTRLPNNNNGSQSDIRLTTGLTYHF